MRHSHYAQNITPLLKALAKSMDAGNEDEAASAVNANDDDDDDDSASVVTALEHGKRNNVGGEETADDDDDDDEAGSGIDANASQESLASLTAAKLKRFASASYDGRR